MYVLNSKSPNTATFDIERKLNALIYKSGDSSLLKVFAIYDCGRKEASKFKSLKHLQHFENYGDKLSSKDYFHIHANAQNSRPDSNGKFCENVFYSALQYARRNSDNLIAFPTDWEKSDWKPGECTVFGG